MPPEARGLRQSQATGGNLVSAARTARDKGRVAGQCVRGWREEGG